MTSVSVVQNQDLLGKALVGFCRNNEFPEEDVVTRKVLDGDIPLALDTLRIAKRELESEIQLISRERAPEVDAWIKHSTGMLENINNSQSLGNGVIRLADVSRNLKLSVQDGREHVGFLTRELAYSNDLLAVLKGLKVIKDYIDKAESLSKEGEILKSLTVLGEAWKLIKETPPTGMAHAVKMLDDRAFALKSSLREDLSILWASVALFDKEGSLTFTKSKVEIETAVISMSALGDLKPQVELFHESLRKLIILPRFHLKIGSLPLIETDATTVRIWGTHIDRTIKTLFIDLEQIILFLAQHLPQEFCHELSQVMIPPLCTYIREQWLDSAIPPALGDMTAFRKAIYVVQTFVDQMDSMKWNGTAALQDWVLNVPRLWLAKRKETSLDWTRNQIAMGIGVVRRVERVEEHELTEQEGEQVTSNGNDWDTAWSDDEKETSNPTSLDAAIPLNAGSSADSMPDSTQDDEEADAWGWGDDEPVEEAPIEQVSETIPAQQVLKQTNQTVLHALRTGKLTEKYAISSIPKPVFETVVTMVTDGVSLSQKESEENPVSPAAGALFGVPTLVLAMYRAVSPYYYNLAQSGNMYRYNDSKWLSEQLRDFALEYSTRTNLPPRAVGKVKFDSEIQALEKFSRQAYGEEMGTQRTILNDLLGGAQNFLQHDGQRPEDQEAAIDSIVTLIMATADNWKTILSKAAWAQAVGSLISTVARKITLDVQDLPSLSNQETTQIADLIAKLEHLNTLFIPENEINGMPTTAQWTPGWLKLQFLSQVLQSNLKEIVYMWHESDLSLYFEASDVLDLIELTFEQSERRREAIANIKSYPRLPPEAY